MSLTCCIVDDYIANGVKLAEYAKRAGLIVLDINIDSVAALEKIEAMQIKPDVVFLDIAMPEMNGLEMADKLQGCSSIVFTTAHRNYAKESYKLKAAYYLVKPITYEEFRECIERVLEIHAVKKAQKSVKDYIVIQGQGKGGLIKIKTDDVIFLKSSLHYIEIYTTSKNYITHKSMKAILDELGGLPFVRVHKSYAVNIEKVTELKDNTIYLIDGSKVDLGSFYKDNFMNILR